MPDSDPSTTRPKARRRIVRGVKLLIFILVIGWLARYVYLRVTHKATPRDKYWMSRIEETYPPAPDTVPIDELQRITSDPILATFYIDYGRKEPAHATDVLRGAWDASREEVQYAERILTSPQFQSFRESLIQAARRTWQHPGDARWYDERWLDRCDMITDALLVHARWSLEGSGDVEAAAEDWLTLLRIASYLTQHCNSSIRERGRTMHWKTSYEIMISARSIHAPFDSRAMAIQIEDIHKPERPIEQIIEPTRRYTMMQFDRWYVREGGNWMDVAALTREGGNRGAFPPSRGWNLLSFIFHDRETAIGILDQQREFALSCTSLSDAYGFLRQPDPPLLGALDGYVAYQYTHDLCNLVFNHFKQCLRGEVAATMVALSVYRHQSGGYPEALEALVPQYLPRLPIDYGDFRPLRYRRIGQDYLLYSVGADGVDQGGRESRPRENEWWWWLPDAQEVFDIVYSTWERVDLRWTRGNSDAN